MNKIDSFMDNSAITAKVKTVLVDRDDTKSTDISIKTDQEVMTLGGFAESQAQAEEVVKVAKGVEGVTSVSGKLHVRDAKEGSVKDYAGDIAIASEIKAKLLANDIVPSRHMKVEATGGMIRLSSTVDSQAQSDRAESITKTADGMRNVKNDLKTK